MKKVYAAFLVENKKKRIVKISSNLEIVKNYVALGNLELENILGEKYHKYIKYTYKEI